jgi:hypothetical protein
LDIYWRIIVICWEVLEEKKDKDPSEKSLIIDMSSFQSLYIDALKRDKQGQLKNGYVSEIAKEYNE